MLAARLVGPVTVKPVNSEIPPTMPLKLTLPPVAEPVVAVKVKGPLTVDPKRIGEDVVVMVVLPINDTEPLNMAPIEFAGPLRVKLPVIHTGVDAEVVNDFKLSHKAPSMGK